MEKSHCCRGNQGDPNFGVEQQKKVIPSTANLSFGGTDLMSTRLYNPQKHSTLKERCIYLKQQECESDCSIVSAAI